MEIHILQAGEHLGPFSENQVRQYLGEGRVAPSDLAICEGIEYWQPIDRILSQISPSASTTQMIPTETKKFESLAPTEPPEPEPDSEPPMNLDEETPQTPASPTAPLPVDATKSLALSQKTKRKLNKIVLQPILPLEPASPTATVSLKRKLKTGKTALTMEPLRPTTALPPVTGFVPKEKKPAKTLIKTGQLTFGDFAEKPAQIILPPELPIPEAVKPPPPLPPPTPITALPSPVAAPAMEVAPAESLLPPPTRIDDDDDFLLLKPWYQRVPREIIYAVVVLAVIIFCVISAIVYLIVGRHDTSPSPGAATPDTTSHASTQEVAPAPTANPQTSAEFSARGFAIQKKGEIVAAIKDYNSALGLDPKNVQALFRRGLARQTAGDAAGALADYTQAISLDPKQADAFSNRAFIKQAQGDVDGALADYNLALQINPRISAAYFNMGLIKVQRGDIDGAIAAYDRAVELDPKMDLAYYNRGVAKNTEGNLEGAIADFTQAVSLNPKLARAFCARGFSRQSRGDADGATADYTAALALNPGLTDAYYNRGLIKVQQGDMAGAVDDNSKALLLDPKYAAAYFHRGLAQFGLGSLDNASADLKQFCELSAKETDADSARLYLWLADTSQNLRGQADAALSSALINDWNSPPDDLTSKIGAFLAGHINESELIANAASPDPGREPARYCEVWYFAGMKRLLAGDKTTAIACFQKSVATNQKDVREYVFSQLELKNIGNAQVLVNTNIVPARAPAH